MTVRSEPANSIDPRGDTAITGASRDSISPIDETLAPDGPPPSFDPVNPPTIGRYLVLDRLGEGGMGVVLAAYDPKLDRKVALKLIHALRRDDGERRRRMEREAQAMARLSHPNVVTVYEVGEHDDQLFLAMEFVQGRTLREWLHERPRGWRDILAVFLQAGEGLAAAHRAGLVHRDFKPDNVFVGDDGRVRVGDFGLARSGGDDPVTSSRARTEVDVSTALDHDLTTTGAMMGTPAYMAPEQFVGGPTDARTDQFALANALWEALHGHPPFVGGSLVELREQVLTGRRAPPPPGARVPAWLRAVLDRGLSSEPGARWPTTEALLAALQRDPTRRRRALAGLAVAAVAATGWLGLQQHHTSQQIAACAADGAAISGVWNDAAAADLRAGLLATGVAYAGTTADRLAPVFAARADAWREARTGVCLDTHVHRTVDADTLDRATACLDEQRMQMHALIAGLSRPDNTTLERAVPAAAALAPIAECRDVERLRRAPPLPADRPALRAVQALLTRADALRIAGAVDEALAASREAVTAAERLAWSPLIADAGVRHGLALGDAGAYADAEAALERAYFQAAEVAAHQVAADAATALALSVGEHQARHADGLRWIRHADVALAALAEPEDGMRRLSAVNAHAVLRHAVGDYPDAQTRFERVLSLQRERLGPEHSELATTLANLAGVHYAVAAYPEAAALYEQALAIAELALGPDHPGYATILDNLATIRVETGDHLAGVAHHTRALAIRERALGPDHPDVAMSLSSLAYAHQSEGRFAEAKALLTRALAIDERTHGPEHPEVAMSLNNLATALHQLGEDREAHRLHLRSLAIKEKVLGPDHPEVAASLCNLGDLDRVAGAHAEARARYERAVAIWSALPGPGHPGIAVATHGLALVAHAERRFADAVTLAERAVSLREAGSAHPTLIADSRLALAQALDAAGREPARVRALAGQVRDVYRESSPDTDRMTRAEDFLARLR